MHIDIITCLPQLLESFFAHSILQRAIKKSIATIHMHNIRDYAINKHGQIDDYTYGGAAGMVLMAEPIIQCIEYLQSQRHYDAIIYMAPDGTLLTQQLANQLSLMHHIIVICGHYKGIDERIRQYCITQEISIGEYVLSGGELAAAVLVDAIIRLIPGVLSDETSALTDSFQDGLIAPPTYTRPASWRNIPVPQVLLSGNQQAIDTWNHQQALTKTKKRGKNVE